MSGRDWTDPGPQSPGWGWTSADRVEAAAVDAVHRYLATDDSSGAAGRVRFAMDGLSVTECVVLAATFRALAEITQGPGR